MATVRVETGVPGAIDLAHSSCANGGEDFIGAKTFAGKDRQRAPASVEFGEYSSESHLQDCLFIKERTGGAQKFAIRL